ncbi:rhodanese-like domain-containing protein, partial [Bacteroidia bacterium]|nr:rhodanese-like domain-containing protein [Bacteroidia bacterium]
MNKIILLSLLATVLFACANTPKNQTAEITQQAQKPSVKAINSTDLPEALLDENVVLIDVRTPDEVASGYIKGAHKFIDINGNSFESEIDKLDKSKTYIMY